MLAKSVCMHKSTPYSEQVNQMETFAKIPHPRYINFVAEFLANEHGATRAGAIVAWAELKTMDTPKTYAAWVKTRGRKRHLKTSAER